MLERLLGKAAGLAAGGLMVFTIGAAEAPAPAPAPAPDKPAVILEGADGVSDPKTDPKPDPKPKQDEDVYQRLLEQARLESARKSRLAAFYYDRSEYAMALDMAKNAVSLDPDNKHAVKIRDLAMQKVESIAAPNFRMQDSGVVPKRDQQQVLNIQIALENGERAYQSALDPEDKQFMSADAIYDHQLHRTSEAITHLDRADELIRFVPARVDISKLKSRAVTLRAAVESLRKQALVNLNDWNRNQEIVRKQKVRDQQDRQLVQKLAILVDQAQMHLDKGMYKKAEKLAADILREDPFNRDAMRIQVSAQDRQYNHDLKEVRWLYNEHMELNWEHVDLVGIPPARYITYPDDWADRTKRRVGQQRRQSRINPKNQRVHEKLSVPITFNFDTDTPLRVVIELIKNRTGLNLVFDANANNSGAGDQMVQLAVTDMPCRDALTHVLKQRGLTYRVIDGVVMMYNAADTQIKPQTVLEIYDVSDLIRAHPNFTPPTIEVLSQSGNAPPPPPPPPAASISENEITDLIQRYVDPPSWQQGGTVTSDNAGRLLVTQTPEVQDKVEMFLRKLREQQSVQVLVETQFIEVRDQFLEQIGVHFTGLDNITGETGLPWVVGNGTDPTGVTATADPNEPSAAGPIPARPTNFYRGGGGPGGDGQFRFSPTSPTRPGAPYGLRDRFAQALGLGETVNTTRLNPLGINTLGDLSVSGLAGAPGQGGLLQFRYAGGMLANAILQAVAKEQTADQLMAPRLTVFNGQRAYVLIGQQTAYIEDYNVNGATLDPVIGFFMTGAILGVRPNVSHDRRYISMDLEPGVAVPRQMRILPIDIPGTPDPIVELPDIEIRSLKTTATVPDGGTLVLSGMITDLRYDGRTGVPILMDIPLLGRLFVQNSRERDRRNLIILVKGTMVLFDEEEEKLSR